MAIKEYTIKEFKGIDQSKGGNRIDPAYSPDACNMDTAGGDLMVARGYVKHTLPPVPGEGAIRRLYIWRDLVTVRTIVIAGREVYAYVDTAEDPAWKTIYTYPETDGNEEHPEFTGLRWDFLETKIGNDNYLIIACGESQLIKWDGKTDEAVLFGTEEKVSNHQVNFICMHYGRMFACGDRDNPGRLYYSQPPGDERSVEDWQVDEASENASGGHVEVGDTSTDPITGMCALSNQLLIFKRDSIYRLLGDRPSNYRITRVHAEVEEMANSSLVIYGDTPFWMTNAGMYYHDGQNSMPIYNARQIKEITANVKLNMSKAAENRDRLYFTCRQNKNGESDDAIIVYDVVDKTYMLRNGFYVADLCSRAGVLYMINAQRIIYRFDEGDDYDGNPISAYWETPLTDLDNKPGIKAFDELYSRFEARAGEVIRFIVRMGKHEETYRKFAPENIEDVLEVPLKNEARTFTMRIENEAGSRWKMISGCQILYNTRQRAI